MNFLYSFVTHKNFSLQFFFFLSCISRAEGMELQPNVHVLVPISIISSINSKGTLKQHQTFFHIPSLLPLIRSSNVPWTSRSARVGAAPLCTCFLQHSCPPEHNPHASNLTTSQHIKCSRQGELITASDHRTDWQTSCSLVLGASSEGRLALVEQVGTKHGTD